jgi:hypothetical protein
LEEEEHEKNLSKGYLEEEEDHEKDLSNEYLEGEEKEDSAEHKPEEG